jgi:hypothetical protein
MPEKILSLPLRWTSSVSANKTRLNLSAASLLTGNLDDRPAASECISTLWLDENNKLYYSNGTSWTVISSGGSSGTPSPSFYYKIWTYQTVTTAGEEVWLRSQAKTIGGCSWSRTGTSLVVTMDNTASVGDHAVVITSQFSLSLDVTSCTSTTVTFTVSDSGTSTGSDAEIAIVPGYNHDASGPTKKGGILKTPSETQVISMVIHTGDRDATYDGSSWTSSGYYYVTLPSNAAGQVVNGIGGTSGVDRAIIPMLPLNAAYTQSMTRVIGAFANYDTGGTNFAKIRFEGLGSTPVILRVSF